MCLDSLQQQHITETNKDSHCPVRHCGASTTTTATQLVLWPRLPAAAAGFIRRANVWEQSSRHLPVKPPTAESAGVGAAL